MDRKHKQIEKDPSNRYPEKRGVNTEVLRVKGQAAHGGKMVLGQGGYFVQLCARATENRKEEMKMSLQTGRSDILCRDNTKHRGLGNVVSTLTTCYWLAQVSSQYCTALWSSYPLTLTANVITKTACNKSCFNKSKTASATFSTIKESGNGILGEEVLRSNNVTGATHTHTSDQDATQLSVIGVATSKGKITQHGGICQFDGPPPHPPSSYNTHLNLV
ncbi:hypothetical protein RRG08_054139 [Elysia crispata]|uniref:Uncharacterized protein n=1 Tax=Elysia crispata TaxID=231223 RepID=A0AAE0Y7U0_9GAST|nr:hypothetical protein RRG08_054139 [Elysia crispata]